MSVSGRQALSRETHAGSDRKGSTTVPPAQKSQVQVVERLTRKDLQLVHAVLRQLYAPGDRATFVTRVLATVPQIVPSEITSYNEVYLRRRRITAVMDPPGMKFSEQLWGRHMDEHPLVGHYQRTGDGRAHKISDFLTQRQFRRLGLYNEVYRQMGVEHQMSLTLAPRPLLIALTLNRSRRDFCERDRLVLNLVRPHLIQAYHTATMVSSLRQEVAQLTSVLEDCQRGLIGLTSEGRVRLMTDRARRWLQDYYGWSACHHACRLPEDLWRWVCQQQSGLTTHDQIPPPRTPLVREREGRRLTVRLLAGQAEGHMLLLVEERDTGFTPVTLAPLGLSKRERDILYWVARGKTNKEAAALLGLSPHTVRTRLERVYRKLDVETRTAAVARALEVFGMSRQ